MKNKCSCYGGFDCVICNPDKYADTPRTDAAEPQLHSNLGGWVRGDFARELERELAASNAEVEELQQQKRNCLEIIEDDAKEKSELKSEVAFWKAKAYEAEEMEGKHEAEVERLKKLTEDCLNVIRVYCPTYYNDAMERFKTIN